MNAKQRNKNRATHEALHYALQTPIAKGGRIQVQRTKGAQKTADAFERQRPR